MLKHLDIEFYAVHGEILLNSYKKLLGRSLFAKTDVGIIELWNAPFAVVSHGTEKEPIFNFGNRIALELFELDFSEFITMASRKSAEKVNQAERARLLAEVSKNGFITNYSGVRMSATGKRFVIEDAVVWNLADEAGRYYGQAAMFEKWKYLQGMQER